jgi:hypothetical protein
MLHCRDAKDAEKISFKLKTYYSHRVHKEPREKLFYYKKLCEPCGLCERYPKNL